MQYLRLNIKGLLQHFVVFMECTNFKNFNLEIQFFNFEYSLKSTVYVRKVRSQMPTF